MNDEDRASTMLPTPPVHPKRANGRASGGKPVNWGQRIARVFCVLLAIVGALPIAAAFLVRSTALHEWAATRTRALLTSYGIVASYQLDVHLWPLSVELDHLQLDATDGGSPFFSAKSIKARPRAFPLLAGKLVVDSIEAEAPSARVVLKKGELQNLALKLPKSEKKDPSEPFRAPFRVISISDGLVDLTIDDAHAQLTELDVDVSAEDAENVPAGAPLASSFEIAMHAGHSSLDTPGQLPAEDWELSDAENAAALALLKSKPIDPNQDLMCSLDGRIRIDPDRLLVRHLELQGVADVFGGSAPSCELPENDPSRVEVALSHFHAKLRTNGDPKPDIDGHAKVRAPVGIASRFADLPRVSGWIGADVDVRYAEDTPIPEVSGRIEAHDAFISHFHLVEALEGDVTVKAGLITSSRLAVNIAQGVAILSDVAIDLKAMALTHVRLDAHDISFASIIAELGINHHPHVGWNLRELHIADFKGTFSPLKLDGELIAHTTDFNVFDNPTDDPARKRVIGVTDAALTLKVAVRPKALQFQNAHVVTPRSVLDATVVSLGYDEALLVDLPKAEIDLADITPLATTAIGGHAHIGVKVTGHFTEPELVGQGSIDNFSLGDIPFGDVTEVHANLEGVKALRLTNVHALKNKSAYEMPTAILNFGGQAGLELDAEARADALGLRDFLALFHFDDDPRFSSFDADIAPKAKIHLALGGPEDPCGGGFVDVRAALHAKNVKMYGEEFADGDADLEYRSYDSAGGIQGVDVEVRSAALHRLHAPGQEPIGQILGSASIHRGGVVRGTLSIDGMPLARLSMLGALSGQVEGAMSGLVDVSGKVDAPAAQMDIDVTPVRVRGAAFGPSHLHIAAAMKASDDKPIGHTKCGAPIGRPFDKNAAAAPTMGDVVVDGTLFGDQVSVTHLALKKDTTTNLTGAITLRKLDLGAALQAASGAKSDPQGDGAKLNGHLSGLLVIEQLPFDEPEKARVRFTPTEMEVAAAGGTLTLHRGAVLLDVQNDRLTVPAMKFDLAAAGGFSGSFTLRGQVAKLTHGGDLGLTAELAPIDLALLSGLVPKLDRASGTLVGQMHGTGTFAAPNLEGTVTLHGGDFTVSGLPSAVSDVELEIKADNKAIAIDHASARFAGGQLTATGRLPIKGFVLGTGELHVNARGVHLAPAEGVSATLDADLTVALDRAPDGLTRSANGGGKKLPHVTGDILVTAFDYTRPVNLLSDVGGLSVSRKPRAVQTYDPTLDALTLDLRVRSKVPLRIKNNLAELELDVGQTQGLVVSGTNQRIGLRGELRALPGGHFHLFANEFEIKSAAIRFDDPTRIAPIVDVTATTEYRRYTDSSAAPRPAAAPSPTHRTRSPRAAADAPADHRGASRCTRTATRTISRST